MVSEAPTQRVSEAKRLPLCNHRPCSPKESVEPRFAVVVRGMYVVNEVIVANNWNPSFVMPEGATDIQEAEDDHGVCQRVGNNGVGEEHADPLETTFHEIPIIGIWP